MARTQCCRTIMAAALGLQFAWAAASISGPTITPGTISFTSGDPDSGPVAGSSTASVAWGMQGNANGSWTLTIRPNASFLALCPNVPTAAIKVQCTALAKSGTGNPGGNCTGGAQPLSGTVTLASGQRQGDNSTITATISFTFTDGWKYPASTACSLDLTYTVTAN